MDYFIDESGQTGDVARLNTLSDFNDQLIFCLAVVGVANEFSLEQEINRLSEKHRVRFDELKSSARRKRPEFTYDLVKLICTEAIEGWHEDVKCFSRVKSVGDLLEAYKTRPFCHGGH